MAAAEALALYLTYSRGSMAGLVAGVAVIGLLRYRKLLLAGAVAAALLIFLPQTKYIAFCRRYPAPGSATLMRLGEYKDALAFDCPLSVAGVGFAPAHPTPTCMWACRTSTC